MKILFAPAKSFSLDKPTTNFQTKYPQTEKLIHKLARLSKHSIEEKFKVSPSIAEEVQQYYKQFDQNAAYRAIDLYHGESYKSLDVASLSNLELTFLNDHCVIIDALYGIIQPLDSIKPYRLDFTISGLDLNNVWKPLFEQYFKTVLEPVLSLASDEFTSKIKPFVPTYEVHFLDCKESKCKAISVFNKQQRGALLRHIVQNQINSIEALPKQFNGYTLKPVGLNLIYERLVD